MLELQNIDVCFNRGTVLERQALININLKLIDGQFTTVIGSNGAGKSTLLSVITGNVIPNQGKILLAEQDITSWSVEKRSGVISRVFQSPTQGTCGPLSIEENLALAYKRGQSRSLYLALTSNLRKKFRDVVAELNMNLENYMQQPIESLSGGQRQAIALMMAVLSPMKILILDEHTAALDPKTADMIINLTKHIVQQKTLTVLMVTHSMPQALDIGHRTIMLNGGQIIKDLSTEQRSSLTSHDLLKFFEELDTL